MIEYNLVKNGYIPYSANAAFYPVANTPVSSVTAPLTDGMVTTTSDALNRAVEFLGEGYKEIDSGVFRSDDGTKQVRFTNHDLADRRGPHLNFETGISTKNKYTGRETFAPKSNVHVFIK